MTRKQMAELIEGTMADNGLDPTDHEDFLTDLLDRMESETEAIDEEDEEEEQDEEELE